MRFGDHADDGIAEDGEIGTWTDVVIATFELAILGAVDERGNEMAACGETHHADALRIDLPLLGMATDVKHGFHGILKLRGIAIARAAESVAQHEDGQTVLIQPERKGLRLAFVDAAVAATGDEQHRRAARFGGEIGRERRDVLWRGAESARCAIGPERDPLLGGEERKTWQEPCGSENQETVHSGVG